MDRFRVGQKVRIIKSCEGKSVGEIHVVTGKAPGFWRSMGHYEGYILSAMIGCSHPEEWLEPVYDGDQKSSWSESAWKPKELVKS